MAIGNKISGRVKKAAGDLAGDADLRRRGRRQERAGEAKDELARADERAARKSGEVERLERQTGGPTREELYAQAQARGIEGRSKMNKAELRRALAR